MQVTKELIENDIRAMEAQVEQLKAQTAQSVGALAVLRNMRDFIDKPDKPEEEEEEKKEDKVETVNDNVGIKTVNQVGDNKVVDARGKYVAPDGKDA